MFTFLIGKCPLNGSEYTASDWWQVISRHQDYDCAENAYSKITKTMQEKDKYIIFKLKNYQIGEQFNIKDIQDRHKV